MFDLLGRPRGAAALLGATAVALVASASSAYAQEQQRSFDIPAQPLSSALIEFSRQSGKMVVADPAAVNGRQAPAVRGTFTPSEALNQLLAGSGRRASQRPGGGFVVADAAPTAQFERIAQSESIAQPERIAQAERTSRSERTTEVGEVVVTGSMLNRPVSEQSQLITTVDAQDLELAGAGNSVEALRTVTQNQATITSAVSVGFGTGFASFASLRSLGPSSTLVLFDSQRVAPNAFEGRGVDLNTLPLNMIERIETLSDGASSIYGSDAIAGVINFIPRREFKGLSISVGAVAPEKSGGEKWNASISGGIGDLDTDGWNVYAGYAYQHKDALFARDRDFTRTTYIPERGFVNALLSPTFANWTQAVGNVPTVGSPQNPYAPACNPPINIFAPLAPGNNANACFKDTGAGTAQTFPAQTDQSFLINGSLRLGQHTVSLQYFVAETDLKTSINEGQANEIMNPTGAAGVNPYFPGHVLYPTGGPALPAGFNPNAAVQVAWRTAPFGVNTVNPITQTDRYLARLEGKLLGWDYKAFVLTSRSSVKLNGTDGYFDRAGLRDMLRGTNPAVPYINPFGPQSAAAASYIETLKISSLFQSAVSSIDEFGLQVSRDLFELPAGAVQLAVAADFRTEEAHFRTTDAAVRAGVTSTMLNIDGDRDVAAVTSEIFVPLLDNLDVNLSLRHDDYSDFGSTTNPKVLVTWRPMEGLSLRASYNEGFRAPTLRNLFAPRSIVTGLAGNRNDPVLCPGGVPVAGSDAVRDCSSNAPNLTGGNPDIAPETSKAFSAGATIEPTSDLTLGFDYWNYHIYDTISTVAVGSIFGDPVTFGSLLVRCSQGEPQFLSLTLVSGRCTGLPSGVDPIAYVNVATLNLGQTKTSGIDFTAHWRGPEILGGNVSVDYRSTLVLKYDYQNVTNGPFFNRNGVYRDDFPVIQYSHFATVTWENDLLTLQLANRYLDGYVDCNAGCSVAAAFHQGVDGYSLWDLAATWRWPGKATITGRITNLMDEDPPFSNRGLFRPGIDERFAESLGRAYSLTVRYDF